MVSDSLKKWIPVILTLLLVPAAGVASPKATRATPDFASNTSLSASKAEFLLQQIQASAFEVRDDADQLESYNLNAEMNWRTHSDLWEDMRDQVNDMGQMLHQLEINEAGLRPWERKAVTRMTPALIELANNTEGAINFLNNNHNHLFAPTYANYTVAARDEAHRIELSLKNFEQYAQTKHELKRLSKNLDLKGNS